MKNNVDSFVVFAVLCVYGKCYRYPIHRASTFLRNMMQNKDNNNNNKNSCMMLLSCMPFRCRSICSRLNGSCDIPGLELDNIQLICSRDAASEVVARPGPVHSHSPSFSVVAVRKLLRPLHDDVYSCDWWLIEIQP